MPGHAELAPRPAEIPPETKAEATYFGNTPLLPNEIVVLPDSRVLPIAISAFGMELRIDIPSIPAPKPESPPPAPRGNRRTPQELESFIMHLHAENPLATDDTLLELTNAHAAELGLKPISYRTVGNILSREGVSPRTPARRTRILTQEELNRVIDLITRGNSITRITEITDIPRPRITDIYEQLHGSGPPRRSNQPKELPLTPLQLAILYKTGGKHGKGLTLEETCKLIKKKTGQKVSIMRLQELLADFQREASQKLGRPVKISRHRGQRDGFPAGRHIKLRVRHHRHSNTNEELATAAR